MGLDGIEVFSQFQARVKNAEKELVDFLKEAKRNGKKVCGLGASTKGNVLLQYFGIDANLLEAIGEVNDDKFGAYTPGSLIPLKSEEEVLLSNPDYLLVLPWHFRSFFLNLPSLRGMTLVFPLPNLEIVRIPDVK